MASLPGEGRKQWRLLTGAMAHESQKGCLRATGGESIHGIRSTKRLSYRGREISCGCGSVTMRSGTGVLSHTVQLVVSTRRICSCGIARNVSNNSDSAMSAPVMTSLIPLSSQSGARMHVWVAKDRRRNLGASSNLKRETGKETGDPLLSHMDRMRDLSWEGRLRRRLRSWKQRGALRGAWCKFGIFQVRCGRWAEALCI